MDACHELLQKNKTEGNGVLLHTVTGDESWVHHFQPEMKTESKEWCHSTSPKPKNSTCRHLWEK
jgi:hypothetical protein